MRTCCIDLVLFNGELVRIECPAKFEGELHDTLRNAQRRGDNWSPLQFCGCTAEYMGLRLERVNMAQVVGML